MSDKLFYVLMAMAAQICIFFGWGNDSGWLGNAALVIGGLFAGVLMAELLNDGDME